MGGPEEAQDRGPGPLQEAEVQREGPRRREQATTASSAIEWKLGQKPLDDGSKGGNTARDFSRTAGKGVAGVS